MHKLLIACVLYAIAATASAGAHEDIITGANQGDMAVVVGLLNRGMDVNTADRSGSTILMIAARSGNKEMVEGLLARRANVNRRNQYGDTALLLAVLRGYLDVVRMLIDKGADLNPSGWTALHYAMFGANHEIATLLIAKGAALDARAPNGETPLMVAVKQGKLEMVQLLIDADADMDLTDFEDVSALRHALKLGHEDIAAYLRKVGAVE